MGDSGACEALGRSIRVGQNGVDFRVSAEGGEGRALLAQVEVVWERWILLDRSPEPVLFPDDDEAVGLGEVEGTNQDGVDHGEEGGIGSDG